MFVFRLATKVSFFTFLSRILGFVRDILIASILGVGFYADVFFVAFRFPNTFRRLLAEGSFNSSFKTLFQRILKKLSEEPKLRVGLCHVISDFKNSYIWLSFIPEK